ncbi:AAA family ATPase [Micromonospora sp. NPDC049102]|uniref:AAA family ATPase n=1 Tax=Micromonospora sp. NPDC049102 TaxID=3364265 RepID=UPI0037170C45
MPGHGEWTLDGRDVELKTIEDVVAARVPGLVLVGDAGVGKTRLLREALARAGESGVECHWVSATGAARSIPFGAVSHLIPAPSRPYADPMGLVVTVERDFARRSAGRTVMIGIDDAHLLDEPSAGLLHQLAVHGLAVAVATVRAGEPLSDALTSLWTGDGRLEVRPLPATAVDHLLDEAAPGPLDALSRRRLRQLADGNPLLLRELLADAMETGGLQESRGVWRWRGTDSGSPRLAELVSARLRALETGRPSGVGGGRLRRTSRPGAARTIRRPRRHRGRRAQRHGGRGALRHPYRPAYGPPALRRGVARQHARQPVPDRVRAARPCVKVLGRAEGRTADTTMRVMPVSHLDDPQASPSMERAAPIRPDHGPASDGSPAAERPVLSASAGRPGALTHGLADVLARMPLRRRDDALVAGMWQLRSGSVRHPGIAASRHRGIPASRHPGIAASRHPGIPASRHPGIALAAARQAIDRFDIDLAERLARTAYDAGQGWGGAVVAGPGVAVPGAQPGGVRHAPAGSAALAGAADGLLHDDGPALEAAADDLVARGHTLLAAEAVGVAARAYARRGRPRLAVAQRAATLAEACRGVRTPLLAATAPGVEQATLTRRERDVALLAVALSSRITACLPTVR